jgi:hypothetical protein
MRRWLAIVFLTTCACSTNDSTDADGGEQVTDLGTCSSPLDASAYPLSALPSGQSCTPQTNCTMPINVCSSDPYASPAIYECACTNGAWNCRLSVPSQDPCAGDAGDDAGGGLSDASDATVDSPLDASIDSPADGTPDAPADANDAALPDAGLDASDAS